MEKVTMETAPTATPTYKCADDDSKIDYWPGIARINNNYYKLEKIIP
jgi:hypothetical protein